MSPDGRVQDNSQRDIQLHPQAEDGDRRNWRVRRRQRAAWVREIQVPERGKHDLVQSDASVRAFRMHVGFVWVEWGHRTW